MAQSEKRKEKSRFYIVNEERGKNAHRINKSDDRWRNFDLKH